MARNIADDRGQTSMLLVLGTAVFMMIATTLIVLLGRGVTTETEARTAADAAALAAAESITDQLDARVAAIPGPPILAVPHVVAMLATPGSALTVNASSEASRLAAANGSTLTAMSITPTAHGYEVSATARANETTLDTSRRATFEATASVRVTSGAWCLRNGRIGLYLGGSCVTGDQIHLEPPAPPAPPSDPSDPPEEPPEEPVYPNVPWIFDGDGLLTLLNNLRSPLTWEVTLVR